MIFPSATIHFIIHLHPFYRVQQLLLKFRRLVENIELSIYHLKFIAIVITINIASIEEITRLPGAVPQLIGLFLFCIEFGWG